MHISSGFTLIELLIVLAIVGILSSITFPIYRHYVVRVNRIHATVFLVDLSARMEVYYNENHSYKGSNKLFNSIKDKFYNFEIQAENNNYLIKAIPIGSQKKDDTKCGILMLDQFGNRSISGSGTLSSCWP